MRNAPVSYDVEVLPARHALAVRVDVERGAAGGSAHLRVPTWVPGACSFLRFARAVSEVSAVDAATGAALTVERLGWSGWCVEGAPARLQFSYTVQASGREWCEVVGIVEHDRALVTGTLLAEAVGVGGPVRVHVRFPEGWDTHMASGGEAAPGGEAHTYPDYASLADVLVVGGQFDSFERSCRGTPVHHVFLDRGAGFAQGLPEFLDGATRGVLECWKLFGAFPFEDYTFVASFSPLHPWGMEHRTGCTVGLEAGAFVNPVERARAHRLLVHEVLHAWNGCALRPVDQAGADRERGANPELLWVVEGWTRYYEFLLSVRAGLMPPEALLSNVVNYYRELELAPAYRRVSARDSSRSAFLTHHRYAGAVNTSVDFYDVGMLVAFELDAALRLGGHAAGLDGVLRDLYARHAGRGYTRQDVRDAVAARDPALAARLDNWVDGIAALTVPKTLERLGFHVASADVRRLGILVRDTQPGRVSDVWDDGAAARAGVMPGDELLRVDGQPFSAAVLRWSVANEDDVLVEVRRGHRVLEWDIRPQACRRVESVAWHGAAADLERLRAWWGVPSLQPAPAAPWPLDSHENFHGVPDTF